MHILYIVQYLAVYYTQPVWILTETTVSHSGKGRSCFLLSLVHKAQLFIHFPYLTLITGGKQKDQLEHGAKKYSLYVFQFNHRCTRFYRIQVMNEECLYLIAVLINFPILALHSTCSRSTLFFKFNQELTSFKVHW